MDGGRSQGFPAREESDRTADALSDLPHEPSMAEAVHSEKHSR